ncbi:salicylate hydroxylase [Xylaria longipes]|nr:salicylate hydroxylase [Xylaria longipes]
MARNHFRVAIIGGGLAGATLANALIREPHIEVHVFESAPEFSERGAAVGLGINAQMALNQILPTASAMLDKAGAVPLNSSRLILGSGPEAGTLIFDLAESDPGRTVHRASFLRELLAPLPKEALHPNKKLVTIKAHDGGVELSFQDETVFQFEAVIGADGIFSSVREHVLGGRVAAKAHSATPAYFWDCRNVVPFDKAKAILGDEKFKLDRQYSWVGDGAFLMHDVLESGTMVQCVISGVEKDPAIDPNERKRSLTRESLEESLRSWLGGPIADGMIDLALDQSDPSRYSEWEHKSTPTYANKYVCLVGDAAHATTPWQGAGTGLAIEDSMVLAALLAKVSSAEDIESAFRAYDWVRRPRCQQVIDSSRETGRILCGQSGLEANKLRELLAPRWNFIFGLDMEIHKQDALNKMRKFQQQK